METTQRGMVRVVPRFIKCNLNLISPCILRLHIQSVSCMHAVSCSLVMRVMFQVSAKFLLTHGPRGPFTGIIVM
jgi:hypothetical protein